MHSCPMCKKSLPQLEKECPYCKADLSLLVDYVDNLSTHVQQADALLQAGKLNEAVWKYLEVLEIDPNNVDARKQVGQVVAAIRHFDRAASKQWAKRLYEQDRFRRWIGSRRWGMRSISKFVLFLILFVGVFAAGWFISERYAASLPSEVKFWE